MTDVTLSKAVRTNLLSLQNTADLMSRTQERLATGNKVNSALDNPTNFFTASALRSRANDLNALMDSMGIGIQTLEAADNGITSMVRALESMQSTLRQARQDKTFISNTYAMPTGAMGVDNELTLTGGQFGTTPVTIELAKAQGVATGDAYAPLDFDNAGVFGASLGFQIASNGGSPRAISIAATDATTLSITVDGTGPITFTVADVNAVSGDEMASALNAAFDGAGSPVPVTASFAGGALVFTADASASNEAAAVTVSSVTASGAPVVANSLGFATGGTASLANIAAKTVDELVTEINARADLRGKIRVSNDNTRLRIENLSTHELQVDGIGASGAIDGTSIGIASIAGNSVRKDLATDFNRHRDQLDKFIDDASNSGINLLRGDNLKITFNETGTSAIEIQTRDGLPINAAFLDLYDIDGGDLDSDADIDALLAKIKDALSTVRSQASAFGSSLSIVQNRQDFTKKMINTLETGAANLTLADMNEEAANLLALQTRQQLSSSSLSLAAQADQSVLQLLR